MLLGGAKREAPAQAELRPTAPGELIQAERNIMVPKFSAAAILYLSLVLPNISWFMETNRDENWGMERKKATDFRQELLSVFDRYVHGGISRRAFLYFAKNFIIGGLTLGPIWETP